MNRSNFITAAFSRTLLSSFFLIAIQLFINDSIVYGQTILWSGYTAGTSSYTSGPMFAVITNSPGNYYINSSPRYHANSNSDIHPPNNNCGTTGLLMEMDWGNNANTQNYATTLTMNFAECVYGPITFQIFDINTDNFNSWGDWIDISAMANSGALPAPSVSGCTPNTTVSGNIRRIKGGIASSANTTGCTCGTTNVSIGSSANKITSITLKYYADPGAWALSPNNPAYQYIIVSNLTVGNISCVLPVELLSFDGKCRDGIKEFRWSTASELNNDYFSIEHSKDGIEFSQVEGNIKGAGNSNNVLNYEITLSESDDDYSYYRLKQTDYDGTESFSKIIKSDCNPSDLFNFNLLTDKSGESINIVFTHYPDILLTYEVYDLFGRLISNVDFKSKEVRILMDNFNSGMYFLRITDKTNSLNLKTKPFYFVRK